MTYDDMEDDSEEWDAQENDPDPADEIEWAVQNCGQNAAESWCSLAGTEFCSYRCMFSHSLKP